MRRLAVVNDYNGLHQALRARADELNISRITIDEVSGLTAGHASKLLAPRPMKRLGATTLGLMLQALALKLIVVEDREQMARILTRMAKRKLPAAMLAVRRQRHKSGKHVLISKRFLRKIAPRGGNMRDHNLSAKRRKQIASGAAKARWRKPKVVEVKCRKS